MLLRCFEKASESLRVALRTIMFGRGAGSALWHKQAGRQASRQAGRQSGRQAGRQAGSGRQASRQAIGLFLEWDNGVLFLKSYLFKILK